ncbi:ras-related protein Rab-8B isoform X2 [Felis catus]|uniref:ras-related protein Rab-8B isoform X2 n=1 Tax=Felis catus TaxID=9685 RepID=UPI001D1A1DF5|nr:ras-related protein Rab-8B isoform X2 [Felis catus]
MDTALESPEGTRSCQRLSFNPVRSRSDFELQNCDLKNDSKLEWLTLNTFLKSTATSESSPLLCSPVLQQDHDHCPKSFAVGVEVHLSFMRMFDTLRSFLMHAFGISSASTWCDEKTERPQNSGQAQVNLSSETEKWPISRTKMKSLYTEPGRGEHNPPDQKPVHHLPPARPSGYWCHRPSRNLRWALITCPSSPPKLLTLLSASVEICNIFNHLFGKSI